MPFRKLPQLSRSDSGSLLAKYRAQDKFLGKNDVRLGEGDTFVYLKSSDGSVFLVPDKDSTPIQLTKDQCIMLRTNQIIMGGALEGLRFEGGAKQLNPLGDKIPSSALTPQRVVTTVPPWEKAFLIAKLLASLPF